MAEVAFLSAMRDYLAGPAGITPAFATAGFANAGRNASFPLLSLSLSAVERVDIGLGGGAAEVSDGALPVVSTIDLANPVLEGADGFSLLDEPRTGLTLPHGGLIRADGLPGALGPSDLAVTVDGAPRVLVADTPSGDEFTADPLVGQLTFATALPATGSLVATYHLGIWERSTTLIRGTLDMDVWDSDVTRLVTVSDQSVRAVLGTVDDGLSGVQKMSLVALGPIGDEQPNPLDGRMRRAQFAFEYEHVVDLPVSSGGIITRVATTSELAAFVRDPDTGAMVETVETETDD